MPEVAEILDNRTNFVVVQTPGRRFPGIVIQGDSLKSLQRSVEEIAANLPPNANKQLSDSVTFLKESIDERVERYEEVLRERGLQLPYPK